MKIKGTILLRIEVREEIPILKIFIHTAYDLWPVVYRQKEYFSIELAALER